MKLKSNRVVSTIVYKQTNFKSLKKYVKNKIRNKINSFNEGGAS